MRSLVSRVAWGAGASACGAALLAAIGTAAAASYLVQRGEDRRLSDAATVLAREIDEARVAASEVPAILEQEQLEMRHTGITFAAYARDGLAGGDARLPPIAAGTCETPGDVRACGAVTRTGVRVVAASAHTDPLPWMLAASLAAAVAAAGLAWLASRPIARWLVGPLSRLEARVTSMPVGGAAAGDLGPPEEVAEVEQLRAAIAALIERASRAIGQASRFAADAAHELRTPLTTLRAELELLAEDARPGAGSARELARARATVEHLQSLVERLLVLALPDEDGGARELVALRDVAEDAIAGLDAAARGRVTLRPGEEQGAVHGDPSLLAALLANGLSNALKFGRTAEVALEREGDLAVLRIDDDGPGVAAAERERVFEPFFRSPSARGSDVRGHGLGLALVAHVARRHGGSARFEDGAAGARLAVRIPLAGDQPARGREAPNRR